MSLDDGSAKMSKSNPNELSRINLLDTPDQLRNKLKRCKTDTAEGLEFGNPDRPEATNLLTIYQLMTGRTREEVAAEVAEMRWSDFKPVLADAVIAHLEPIQKCAGEGCPKDLSSLRALFLGALLAVCPVSTGNSCATRCNQSPFPSNRRPV